MADLEGTAGVDPVPLSSIRLPLARLGVVFEDADVAHRADRAQQTWTGRTKSGRHVVVQRFLGRPDAAARKLDALSVFARVHQRIPPGSLRAPRLLAVSSADRIAVLEHIPVMRSAFDVTPGRAVDTAVPREGGRAVALLHRTAPEGDTVPGEVVTAEFEARVRAARRDEALFQAIGRLARTTGRSGVTPSHRGLRAERVLVGSGGEVVFEGWEGFGSADPALDVGMFVGEWLCAGVLVGPDGAGWGRPCPDDAVERGLRRFRGVRPAVDAFWSAYRETRPVAGPALAARATAFAGLHLIDRVTGCDAAGGHPGMEVGLDVGRALVVAPHAFTDALALSAD
ncbi:hypothetical protein A6A08_19125 [Nocardiopsis sp. TSRI0078]|uniref:hypothetical protein n=1 Tax=unclassified Nocardiopsis TaxID=2649073 RepID=UPI00093D88F9|nr:hypothetical protein [Nocardiopsis sp. TSRI0078]OKI22385.1 hypothetical protein A6A08_19125 [Nocardiopsis sp. TSRI0078]